MKHHNNSNIQQRIKKLIKAFLLTIVVLIATYYIIIYSITDKNGNLNYSASKNINLDLNVDFRFGPKGIKIDKLDIK